MANGESQWVTSPESRRDVQRLRAQSHAILTSSETVLADNPHDRTLDELSADTQALYPQENLRQPLRIVIDSQNRVAPRAPYCAPARKLRLPARVSIENG